MSVLLVFVGVLGNLVEQVYEMQFRNFMENWLIAMNDR